MRTRKARLPDAPRVHELIGIYSRQTILLPRSLDEICENIHNFTVAVEAGRVVGCGGLHFYGPNLAEVRSIAVDPETQHRGAGQRIVKALLREARKHGIEQICLFTHIPDYFAQLGFVTVPHRALPEKMFKDCLKCLRVQCCDELAMVYGSVEVFAQARAEQCANALDAVGWRPRLAAPPFTHITTRLLPG